MYKRQGRTHQIRVQLGSRGCPVCGDRKYGAQAAPGGIALYAWRLRVPHPDGRSLTFRLPEELLPPELQAGYRPLLLESDPGTAKIVKAADKLSAYIKCVEELKAGNSEFAAAEKQTRQALVEMQLPCLDYFMAHFLDSFRLTLDELE